MKTVVVNRKAETFDVYIGRPGLFGNPFNSGDRTKDIARFKTYFEQRLKTDLFFKLEVESLRGLRLGCWCAPLPCHGQVIADYLNSQPENVP